jgi:hypothetical protein
MHAGGWGGGKGDETGPSRKIKKKQNLTIKCNKTQNGVPSIKY